MKRSSFAGVCVHLGALCVAFAATTTWAQSAVRYSATECVSVEDWPTPWYTTGGGVRNTDTGDEMQVACPVHLTATTNATYCWEAFVHDNSAGVNFSCRIVAIGTTGSVFAGATASSAGTGNQTLFEDDTILASESAMLRCFVPRCSGAGCGTGGGTISTLFQYRNFQTSCP